MKAQTALLLIIGMSACSTGGGEVMGPSATAGSTSAGSGGSTGTGYGGSTSQPVEAGVLPDSSLVFEAASPDSSLFHPLEPVECDTSDPCCVAFEWPMAEPLPNILMNTGAYVTQAGALYQYVGTETVTWPLVGCSPKKPTLYHCSEGRWWKDMGKTCSAT